MNKVAVNWNGPLCVGSPLESAIDASSLYGTPGVYMYVQTYPKKKVAYVGKSAELLKRIMDHYTNLIGFGYYFRNSDGNKYFSPSKPEDRWEYLNDISKHIDASVADAKRTEFYYAMLEPSDVKRVESILIRRLFDRCAGDKTMECDNGRREAYGDGDPITLHNAFSAGCDAVKEIIGSEPLLAPTD